jgi:hypothetical protein
MSTDEAKQNGWSRRNMVRVLAIMGIVLALALLAASIFPLPSQSNPPASQGNAYLLKRAFTNMRAAKSFSMVINMNNATAVLTSNLDFANQNYEMQYITPIADVTYILVGKDFYESFDRGHTFVKLDNGPDMEFGNPASKNGFNPEEVDQARDRIVEGKPAVEQIDGVECRHMVVDAKDLPSLAKATGSVFSGTIEFWVSNNDSPTLRQANGIMILGGVQVSSVIKFAQFNEALDIKAPPASALIDPRLLGIGPNQAPTSPPLTQTPVSQP